MEDSNLDVPSQNEYAKRSSAQFISPSGKTGEQVLGNFYPFTSESEAKSGVSKEATKARELRRSALADKVQGSSPTTPQDNTAEVKKLKQQLADAQAETLQLKVESLTSEQLEAWAKDKKVKFTKDANKETMVSEALKAGITLEEAEAVSK